MEHCWASSVSRPPPGDRFASTVAAHLPAVRKHGLRLPAPRQGVLVVEPATWAGTDRPTTWGGTGSFAGEEDLADAVEGDRVSWTSARVSGAGGGSRRGADRSGVSAVRGSAGTRATSGCGGGRAEGVAWASTGSWVLRHDPQAVAEELLEARLAPGASIAAGEGEGGAPAVKLGWRGGGEHDRRGARPRGSTVRRRTWWLMTARRARRAADAAKLMSGRSTSGGWSRTGDGTRIILDAQRREQPGPAAPPGGARRPDARNVPGRSSTPPSAEHGLLAGGRALTDRPSRRRARRRSSRPSVNVIKAWRHP